MGHEGPVLTFLGPPRFCCRQKAKVKARNRTFFGASVVLISRLSVLLNRRPNRPRLPSRRRTPILAARGPRHSRNRGPYRSLHARSRREV
jgi:hypothetical protein